MSTQFPFPSVVLHRCFQSIISSQQILPILPRPATWKPAQKLPSATSLPKYVKPVLWCPLLFPTALVLLLLPCSRSRPSCPTPRHGSQSRSCQAPAACQSMSNELSFSHVVPQRSYFSITSSQQILPILPRPAPWKPAQKLTSASSLPKCVNSVFCFLSDALWLLFIIMSMQKIWSIQARSFIRLCKLACPGLVSHMTIPLKANQCRTLPLFSLSAPSVHCSA